MIERSRASRGTEKDLAARILPPSGDTGRKKKNFCESLVREGCRTNGVSTGCRDCQQRRRSGWWQVLRQRDRFELGVDLERPRLVLPVEIVAVRANAFVRMLCRIVIVPRGFDVMVLHGNLTFLYPSTAGRNQNQWSLFHRWCAEFAEFGLVHETPSAISAASAVESLLADTIRPTNGKDCASTENFQPMVVHRFVAGPSFQKSSPTRYNSTLLEWLN